jgi:hypothetical protein
MEQAAAVGETPFIIVWPVGLPELSGPSSTCNTEEKEDRVARVV